MVVIAIVPFEHVHLAGLELQTAQGPDMAALGTRALETAIGMGPAFTALRTPSSDFRASIEGAKQEDPHPVPLPERERVVLGCAGLAINAPHHATAWALFAERIGCREWTVLVASIRGVIAAAGFERIDMVVRDDFERAHRFARHLGFEREGVLRRYGAGGVDFAIYGRIG